MWHTTNEFLHIASNFGNGETDTTTKKIFTQNLSTVDISVTKHKCL